MIITTKIGRQHALIALNITSFTTTLSYNHDKNNDSANLKN